MEQLVTVKAMQKRYDCSRPTARKYLRQVFPHMENPLAAPEWAVRDWEAARTVEAPWTGKRREVESRRKQSNGKTIVPRKR